MIYIYNMHFRQLLVNSKPAGIEVQIASKSLHRLKGWMLKKNVPGNGLLLTPCNGIHTFCMYFPIDAIFLNTRNRIIRISNLAPWRVIPIVPAARSVLELPAGWAHKLLLKCGDHLHFTLSNHPVNCCGSDPDFLK